MSDPTRRGFMEGAAATAAWIGVGGVARAAGEATVAQRIVQALLDEGCDTLFGVPGATCDPLFAAASGPMRVVVDASDLEAGYAADAYARLRGPGAVAVTYGVGTLGLISVVAGAYAERSPMLVLSGGPRPDDLDLQESLGTLYSHSSGRSGSDLALFREVTAAALRVESAAEAPEVVNRAFTTLWRTRRPVYLEVPKQLWSAPCGSIPAVDRARPSHGDEVALADAIAERMNQAARPAVLVGVEVQRLGLQDAVEAMLARVGVPWATTLLAKGTLSESVPGFVGTYAGDRSAPAVAAHVEGADALLCLGCVFGRAYRDLARLGTLLRVDDQQVRIGRQAPRAAETGAVVARLADRLAPSRARVSPPGDFDERRADFTAPPTPLSATEQGLRVDEVVREVARRLTDQHLLITDTSLSMAPAASVPTHGRDGFLANAVWQSIGYSVAASVGAAFASSRRPVVICGDGGFQMTAQALSTLARHGLPVTVVVLDNGLYGIEQHLLQPSWFTERSPSPPLGHLVLHSWDYAALARSMGVTRASTVHDVAGLGAALDAALAAEGPTLVHARLRPHDRPAELGA